MQQVGEQSRWTWWNRLRQLSVDATSLGQVLQGKSIHTNKVSTVIIHIYALQQAANKASPNEHASMQQELRPPLNIYMQCLELYSLVESYAEHIVYISERMLIKISHVLTMRAWNFII